jgi:hypothetical protein
MIFKHAYYYGHVAKKQHISKIEQLKKLALFGASFVFINKPFGKIKLL